MLHLPFRMVNIYGKPLPSKRKFHDKSELEVWEKKTLGQTRNHQFQRKEVEFKAYFTDKFGKKIFIMSYLLFKKVDKNGIMFRGNFWIKIKFSQILQVLPILLFLIT